MENEKQNGLDIDCQSADMRDVGSNDLALSIQQIRDNPLGRLPDHTITAVASILAGGGVAAVLMFELLCFQHPDTANQWIPAVVGVVVPLLVKVYIDKGKKNGIVGQGAPPDPKR